MWIPLVASLGVGAATFYAMSKNNQSFGQTVQKVLPVVSHTMNDMNGNISNSNSNSGQLGPYGMS